MHRWKPLLKWFPIVALVLTLLAATAVAVNGQADDIPMLACGVVYINGEPAEDGTLVEAKIGGEVVASNETYTKDGEQGHYVLNIEGAMGDKVHFFVLGIEAEESPKSWKSDLYHLDLHIEQAYLDVALSAQEEVSVGESFTTTVTVANTGNAGASGVTPTLLIVGPATCTGPTPASAGIPAGGSQDFTWSCTCHEAGNVTISASVTGTDGYTGEAIPDENIGLPDPFTVRQVFTIYLPIIMKNYAS